MPMVNDEEATEPPAPVVHTSDLTDVPLLTQARRAHADPLSVIELMEDAVLPRAHTATIVLPLPLWYAIDSEEGAVVLPVLLWAPPTRAIADTSRGVENVKLRDVVVPAESAEITA